MCDVVSKIYKSLYAQPESLARGGPAGNLRKHIVDTPQPEIPNEIPRMRCLHPSENPCVGNDAGALRRPKPRVRTHKVSKMFGATLPTSKRELVNRVH